jgi:peptidyl-prolyl cis-trans isomerase C
MSPIICRFAATLLALSFAAPAIAEDVTSDTVLATVNGTNITIGHLIALRTTLPQQYQDLPDDVLFKGMLDQLVNQTVIQQSVTEVSKVVSLVNDNSARANIANQAIQAIAGTAVTDASLQAAYQSQYVEIAPGKEYEASHILVDTKEIADAIHAQLVAGEDFAKLAAENSKDPSSSNGGSLGWFGLGVMVKPFEDAVVSLEKGQLSAPIQTQFGWHIIKLNDLRSMALPSLEDVRDKLSEGIRQKAVEAEMQRLIEAADVTRADVTAIDPAIIKNIDLLK